ncbi:hypothetical protein RB195_018402 [Necator americanus]|uniref:Secreted protein n=1 Tax=Necator americanus TaxID=51031 RepID=A0ABR1CCK5_NECAM
MFFAILVLTRTPTPPTPLLSHVPKNSSSPVSYTALRGLLAGPTCGIQGCHESVLAQQKQGVHPLNPPASLGKRKVAFGPRLAPYPPPGDTPRSLATNRL